jgi:hypothetical protein
MRISVLVKFEPDILAEIDAARGPVPRMAWIVRACLTAARRSTVSAAPGSRGPDMKMVEPKPVHVVHVKTVAKAAAPFQSRLKGEWKAP